VKIGWMLLLTISWSTLVRTLLMISATSWFNLICSFVVLWSKPPRAFFLFKSSQMIFNLCILSSYDSQNLYCISRSSLSKRFGLAFCSWNYSKVVSPLLEPEVLDFFSICPSLVGSRSKYSSYVKTLFLASSASLANSAN